jgi:peroxiredoxin Q/BCP
MEGHQRNLYLYDRFDTQVVGVSRDDVITAVWARIWGLPSTAVNVSGWLGVLYDVSPAISFSTEGQDRRQESYSLREGRISRLQDILAFLKKLNRRQP